MDAVDPDAVDPVDAQVALAVASAAASRVLVRARWMSTYLAVFAGGFAVLTLLLGLVQPLSIRMGAFAIGWPLLIAGMVAWAARQPARLRGTLRRVMKYWVATGICYGAVLAVGTPRFIGEPLYWLPAAVLVAAPMVLGAIRERRA